MVYLLPMATNCYSYLQKEGFVTGLKYCTKCSVSVDISIIIMFLFLLYIIFIRDLNEVYLGHS